MSRLNDQPAARPMAFAAVAVAVGGAVAVGVGGPASAYPGPGVDPNNYEKAACVAKPLDCIFANSSASAAYADTNDRFGYRRDGTRVNAFQHASWNARMAVLIGRGDADLFATAHEMPISSGNPPGSNLDDRLERMDLCNNHRGRDLPSNWDIISGDQLTPVGKAERAARSMSTNRSSSDVLTSSRSCNGSKLVLVKKNNGVVIT